MDSQVDRNTTLHDADALRSLAILAYRLVVSTHLKCQAYDRLVALELAERGPSRGTSQQYSITPRGQALVDHFLTVPLPTKETTWTFK